MKDEDFIERLLVANTHDTILCFSSRGRLYWLKYINYRKQIEGSWSSIVNILPLQENERILRQFYQWLPMKGINLSSWQLPERLVKKLR